MSMLYSHVCLWLYMYLYMHTVHTCACMYTQNLCTHAISLHPSHTHTCTHKHSRTHVCGCVCGIMCAANTTAHMEPCVLPHIAPCIPARFTLSITGPASSTASWKVSMASTPSSFIGGFTSARTDTPKTHKDRQTDKDRERERERERERDYVNTQSTTRSQSIRRSHCLMQKEPTDRRLICGNLHSRKF